MDEKTGAERQGESRKVRKWREQDECSSTSSSESEDRRRKRRKRHHRRRRSRSPSSSSSSSDSDDGSESSGEDERHSRKKLRKSEDRERRRMKEKKRKEKRKEEKRKEEKKRKKKEKTERQKTGPVTSSWGKYGLIKEVDMWNKRPEFSAWLHEVKKVNLETMPNWEERQMFKEYMEDYNTATLPSKKYYNIDKYHHGKMLKKLKKGGIRIPSEVERTEFNDEEQRRQELRVLREREKEAHITNLKDSMRSGMAQAMREQAQLREEMQYQYRLGNVEAANAIQKRLEPDPL